MAVADDSLEPTRLLVQQQTIDAQRVRDRLALSCCQRRLDATQTHGSMDPPPLSAPPSI